MDTSSALIGVIMLVLFTLPFIIMSMNKRKKSKQKLQKLKNLAEKHHCQINRFDFCGDFGIGIDETKNYVFFIQKVLENERDQYLDLSVFQSCKPINTSRTVKQKEGNYTIIDKLELVFVPKAKTETEKRLEFYNSDNNMQPQGELQLLEKWSKLIEGNLKANKNQ